MPAMSIVAMRPICIGSLLPTRLDVKSDSHLVPDHRVTCPIADADLELGSIDDRLAICDSRVAVYLEPEFKRERPFNSFQREPASCTVSILR